MVVVTKGISGWSSLLDTAALYVRTAKREAQSTNE